MWQRGSCGLKARARAVLPAIVDAVEKGRDRAQMRDADLALHLLLPEHAKTKRTLSASDLSDEQREIGRAHV